MKRIAFLSLMLLTLGGVLAVPAASRDEHAPPTLNRVRLVNGSGNTIASVSLWARTGVPVNAHLSANWGIPLVVYDLDYYRFHPVLVSQEGIHAIAVQITFQGASPIFDHIDLTADRYAVEIQVIARSDNTTGWLDVLHGAEEGPLIWHGGKLIN